MRVAIITIFLAFLVSNVRAQADCDIATTGVAIVSTTPPNNPISTICVGQHAYFKFSIANLGTSMSCVIPAGSVSAVFSLPVTGTPYTYVGVISPASPYFNWTYNIGANVLIGTNTVAIPQGMGDANILVEVVGNVTGAASSGLNLTQTDGTSDNTANNTGSAQLTVVAVPVVSDQPNLAQCGTSTFTMTQSPPSPGTGLWTLVSGIATITTPTSPTTTITGVTPGASVTVRWTVTNASCSTYDEVTVTNTIAPDLTSDVTSPLSATFTPLQVKYGYVTITNVSAGATTGTIVFRISKPNNFTMELLAATTQVFPEETDPLPVSVDNNQFSVTELPSYFEITSNPTVFIPGGFGSKKIGFKLTTFGGPNTGGIMTVSILNNTGGVTPACGDSNSTNNQSIALFSIN